MYAVILAGGGGTRLWPLSRPDRPKPFLPLLGSTTLLQRTFARLSPLLEARDVYVVTDRRYVGLVREQLPELPTGNAIREPMGRNTAAAIALAALAIERSPDEVMVVLPADHLVLDEAAFRTDLVAAAEIAAGSTLVTLGISPTGPATGYGYILARPPAGGARGLLVDRFVEKPDLAAAEALLATGLAAWNSGIFAWRRDTICDALGRYAPDILRPLQKALSSAGVAGESLRSGEVGEIGELDAALEAVYPSLRPRSVDYAVMEPASLAGEVSVMPIDVGWSDLGSWSALRDAWLAEEAGRGGEHVVPADGVVGSGLRRDVGSSRCLVLAGDRLVVTIGLEDTIVVDTPDAVLVCAADRAQDVRQIAEELALAREDRQ